MSTDIDIKALTNIVDQLNGALAKKRKLDDYEDDQVVKSPVNDSKPAWGRIKWAQRAPTEKVIGNVMYVMKNSRKCLFLHKNHYYPFCSIAFLPV